MAELGLLSQNISELAPRIKAREVSPVEVTQDAIAHAERMQPILKSFITLTPERALRQAQDLEGRLMRGEYLGPLHGIPIGLKDMLLTKGVRTTDGGKPLENYVPDWDATVVERVNAAGTVILGKENMHEIGGGAISDNRWYGRVRNPWDLERIAGGSSGGSAANVASFVTYASIGTDAGGSVRMPSAVCGIVGLKPTYGRISIRGGLETRDPSTYHMGPHTRSVRDSAIMLQAMAGHDRLDPTTVPVPVDHYEGTLEQSIRGLVMGIPSNLFFDPLDLEIAEAVSKAITVLEELGAEPRQVEIKYVDEMFKAGNALMMDYAGRYEQIIRQNRNVISPPERYWLLRSQFVLAKDLVRAQQVRRLFQQEWAAMMQQVDFLVVPTTAMLPWEFETKTVAVGDTEADASGGVVLARNTFPANYTGVPAITVPCGFSGGELPIGLQIMGRPWEESLVLRVAHQYEQATPRSEAVPPAVRQALATG
jgi:aspartyl-tRNA(Asn)/glutamyl-tRNA(Gln) amidotransferase subunit A